MRYKYQRIEIRVSWIGQSTLMLRNILSLVLRNILSLMLRKFYLSCWEIFYLSNKESFISLAQKYFISRAQRVLSFAGWELLQNVSWQQKWPFLLPGEKEKLHKKTKNLHQSDFTLLLQLLGQSLAKWFGHICQKFTSIEAICPSVCNTKKAASTQLPLLFKIHVMSKSLVSHLKLGWCSICVQDYI